MAVLPDAATGGLMPHLQLAAIGADEVSGKCLSGHSGRVFGGQILAHGVIAAARAIGDHARPHSVHAHFLRPGRPDAAMRYRCVTLRRSARFDTTRVDVTQEGDMVATLTVSSHRAEVTPAHSPQPPTVLGTPDEAPPATGGPIPPVDAPIRRPFDVRAANLLATHGEDGRPRVAVWARLRDPVPTRVANAAALAWLSDLALTRVADLEHEHRPGTRHAASLDHATWFHRGFDLARWHLYVLTSPVYRDGLALSCGQVFTPDGALVATVTQECLLRRPVEHAT